MGLINLSQEYLKKGDPSFLERIKMAFEIDAYAGSSLGAIEEHFRKSPPRKKDPSFSQLSAYVSIQGLAMRRLHPDPYFDEKDCVSLDKMDEVSALPLFEIRDLTMTRLAHWGAGDSNRYIEQQKEFRFNRESFVPIPKMVLQYIHDEKRGQFFIKSLRAGGRSRTIEEKNFRDKIFDLIPDLTAQVPESAT